MTSLLVLLANPAFAFPNTLDAWQERYGAISASGDEASCQLCHAQPSGGSPWNGYGWDLVLALDDASCDWNGDAAVSAAEALFCVEEGDSDDNGASNIDEIGLGAQPGWTQGANNTLYSDAGTTPGQLAPAGLTLDPDGTEPPPPPPPPPEDEEPGPLQFLQVVSPGQSIQRALDQALPGGIVFVKPGVYRELDDKTNALNITQSVHLIGLSTPWSRVVLENAGNQRNGIVAVPADRTDCMSCHTSMEPPFDLAYGVEPGLVMDPQIYGLTISGLTIQGFANNGLFTENVDGFTITDVQSIDNRNYGIFPTLSRNGLVAFSYATGSDDSGIWIETSEGVLVTGNLVEGNVNGLEVSNSDDIEFSYNVSRDNSLGLAAIYQPAIFDDRPTFADITIRDNVFESNNKPNTARPGSLLSTVPSGLGVLLVGADDSVIADNLIEDNGFAGIALADYCVLVQGSPLDCMTDPSVPLGFLAAQTADRNQVLDNLLSGNGLAPPPHPFAFAASDLALIVTGDHGNCYAGNVYDTSFSTLGVLPQCQ